MKEITRIPDVLVEAFHPDNFRTIGHQLIDLLADQLDEVQNNPSKPVLPYRQPDEELAFWQNDFSKKEEPIALFKNILAHSIYVHHPHYMGHQVAVPALIGSLAGLISDVMSNGTGVYEMGMASNALEKIIAEWLAKKIGYEKEAGGFLTSGGTLANLTAMLAARKAKAPSPVWENGHEGKLAIMVSEEAHYCIDRAARIMGLGSEGIIKIPVDEQFKIRTDLLEHYYQQTQSAGRQVIAIIGCASSTATGSFDNLDALADFAKQHDLWYHIDGAHGGGVVFSDTYRHLAKGIHRADSVVIDFHKMLLTPALNTALIFKDSQNTYKTFQQRAQYLWEAEQAEEWYHSGKRTFECTKFMMSIKVYAILKTHGEEIFGQNIDRLFALGKSFG